MKKKIILNAVQYGAVIAYMIILLFSSLGTLKMDMGIRYTFLPNEGSSGLLSLDLTFGFGMKVLILILLLVELLLFYCAKEKASAFSIIICAFRILPLLFYIIFDLLFLILNGDISMNLSIFGYFLFLFNLVSLICHSIKHKQLMIGI